MWILKKSIFLKIAKIGGWKMSGKTEKVVGHPDAILFLRISRERIFQHPRMIGSTELMVTFQRNFPMRHQRTNLGPCVVSTELYCSWCSARLGHPPLAGCTRQDASAAPNSAGAATASTASEDDPDRYVADVRVFISNESVSA